MANRNHMCAYRVRYWSVALGTLSLFLVAACDIPTQAPSIHTETTVDAPIVAEKTFSFLGGPNSANEPLIDTTKAAFDSLFQVANDPADISLEQRIDNFDIGSLEGVLNEAGGALSVTNSSFGEDLFIAPTSGSLPDTIIYKSGTLEFEPNDRVAFGNADNYVQAVNATVEMGSANIKPAPDVVDTLEYTYPDVRTKPYALQDTLVVRFLDGTNVCSTNPCNGAYEYPRSDLDQGFSLSLDTIQVYPDKNTLSEQGSMDFGIRAWLNEDKTLSKGDTVSVSGEMSVQDFDLSELSASEVKAFSVQVTPDANGDGDLDIADDNEVRTAAFNGFAGITNRVEGLQLADVSLDFDIRTENLASTDAQIYSAIQGTNESNRVFLAGEQDQNQMRGEDLDVSSLPFSTGFVESGSSISLSSLTRFRVDLESTSLGILETTSIPVDEDNSNVTEFINNLPSLLRLASQARVNTDDGDLRLRKPIHLDAGLGINIPLQIKGQFVVRDTIDADFSSLGNVADPNRSVSISSATFDVRYENSLPLGAAIEMTIVDDEGIAIRTYTAQDGLQLDAPTKDGDGAANGTATGTISLPLAKEQQELQRLMDGKSIQLAITMTQNDGTPARLRADDTIRLGLKTNVEASVDTGS